MERPIRKMAHELAHCDYYVLPSSPSCKCLDRFSICPPDVPEDDDGQVPFWAVLRALLSSTISSPSELIDLLETIAVTLRGTSARAGNYGLLRHLLDAEPAFFAHHWPVLVGLALRMPFMFPAHVLPVLSESAASRQKVVLSRQQAACLVIHQFLGTLASPPWKDDGIYDFAIWFGSEQPHEKAAHAYLKALFLYFRILEEMEEPDVLCAAPDSRVIEYSLLYPAGLPPGTVPLSLQSQPLAPVEINFFDDYDTSPRSLGLPNGAAVVSANKFIGFGRSATQEEVHIGISPEACPAVLVTPPLTDDHVLVIRGARAMVNVVGQRRNVRVQAMPVLEGGEETWGRRTMLFMDALEMDDMLEEEGSLPDLRPGNVDREIRKATLAFSSGCYNEIWTGLWGCGAFGGDPGVKVLAMWCAASVAGVKLRIVCDSSLHAVGREIACLVDKARKRLSSVEELRGLLASAPVHLQRFQTVQWFSDKLSLNL